MASFVDNCKFNPTAGGTTDWTFSSAVLGSQSPSAAGAVNGAKYKFLAISADQTQWELAEGAYTSSTGVFARTTVLFNSSGTTSKITFSAAPTVAIVALLEDLLPVQAMFGAGMANGRLVASVASNVLTVAVKTFDGNDPSAASPVFFFFRDATAATGDYTCRVVTSALSINTNAAGATLGVPNSQAFRLWVHAFDNAGAVVLALWQSVTFASAGNPTGLACWNESVPVSTTGVSSTATAAATFYTPNGTALTGKAFVPLGYMDFAALTTAGSYTAVPTTIQLYRAGVKRPGDTGNRAYATSTTAGTNATTSYTAQSPSASITPGSASNLVRAQVSGQLRTPTSAIAGDLQIFRGSTAIGQPSSCRQDAGAANAWFPINIFAYDAPGTTSSTTYQPEIKSSTASNTVQWLNPPGTTDQGGTIELVELHV